MSQTDIQMMSSKRSSDEFENEESSKQSKWEEISTEDIEEANHQIRLAAAKGRVHLVSQAKKHFESRNGFQPNEGELSDVFNTLRDSMIDEDTAQTSSDEDEEDSEQLEKMQTDIQSAYENVRDLGKEAGKKLQAHLKDLWEKENKGESPSKDESDAVIYNLKHMVLGLVTVDEEGQTDDEEYEPTEGEKQKAAEEEDELAQREEIAFDFASNVKVSEEQFEALVEKFTTEKGRAPTSEEADTLLSCFSQKLSTATFDEDDSDYEQEHEDEDESDGEDTPEADKSLKDEMDVESDESDDQEYVVEPRSDAFQYMEELEEGSDVDEPTKVEQSGEGSKAEQVCA